MKKNILFITHTYTTFQKSQIEAVADYFDCVFVLVRYKPIAEISRFFPIRSLRSHSKKMSIDLRNKPENVCIYPVPIFYLPWEKSYLKLGERLFKKSKRIIEQEHLDFDIIHAHYFWTSGYVAVKLKEKCHKPVVITNHSTLQVSEYLSRSSTWKRRMTQTIVDADHIFVVNNFMKQKTLEIDPKANVEIIPIGFNQAIFYPIEQEITRKQLTLPIESPIILNISRLDDNKNLSLFINAVSQLLPKYPNLHGLIVGDGPCFKKLSRLINDLNIGRSVKLIGSVPHQEINQWINAADMVALTSFSEGSPTVMYESLGCGRPFLGSAVGGIPEIINHEDFGCVFVPNNLEDLIAKMEYMLEKSWDRQKIIDYGSNFSQKKMAYDILRVYRKLLTEG